ncbi:MAG: hypothetical protein KF709_02680 [Gemmatimonadaceae bacterium]|nr:hypothetical protein [Gemmatimonadaceae bacterium]
MALELSAADFAAAIGVKPDALPALERAGLPFVSKKKSHVYPLQKAITWFVEYRVTTNVGAVPPRLKQKELADLVGYTPRQISNLSDEGKLNTVVEGGRRYYVMPDCVHQVIAHREQQARPKSGDKMTALEEATLREKLAKAEAAEFDLQERRGELLDRVLVARAIADLLQALKGQLVQFAPRYEADLVGLDSRLKVREILKPAVNAEIVRLQAAAAQVARRIQTIEASEDPDDAEGEEEGDGLRHAS